MNEPTVLKPSPWFLTGITPYPQWSQTPLQINMTWHPQGASPGTFERVRTLGSKGAWMQTLALLSLIHTALAIVRLDLCCKFTSCTRRSLSPTSRWAETLPSPFLRCTKKLCETPEDQERTHFDLHMVVNWSWPWQHGPVISAALEAEQKYHMFKTHLVYRTCSGHACTTKPALSQRGKGKRGQR